MTEKLIKVSMKMSGMTVRENHPLHCILSWFTKWPPR